MRAAVLAAWCSLVIPAVSSRTGPHTEPFDHATAPLSFRLEGGSAQATFKVPCAGCLGGADDDALSFDFQAFPSQQPCGSSNLTLNGEPLAQHWHDTRASGNGTLTHDSHILDLSWESNCLFEDAAASPYGSNHGGSDTAQVLTVTVQKVDDITPLSLSGFTVSFNQSPTPSLLRLAVTPVSPAPIHPAEEWRVPDGRYLLIPAPNIPEDRPHVHEFDQAVLRSALQRLDVLESHQRRLNGQIEQQKRIIESQLAHEETGFKAELSHCETLICKFKAISDHIRDHFNSIYNSVHRNPYNSRPPFRTVAGGHQRPTMIHAISQPHAHDSVIPHIEKPAPAHIHQPSRPDGYSTLPDDIESGPTTPKFRRPSRRHPFIAALHFILVILGLAALYAFTRRCCISIRKRKDRAESREERRNRRAYKRAARKAAFKNWWKSRWGRRRDAKMRHDYEEKKALVLEGEGRLEDAMQNEIQAFRHAHNMVDELVRAEEGRITPPSRSVYAGHRMPGMASIAGVMMGGEHVPTHYQYRNSAHSDETLVGTRQSSESEESRSRSNSLPAYQTDPDTDTESRYFSDNPPSYRTDDDTDDDSDIDSTSDGGNQRRQPRRGAEIVVTNGFNRYAPSEYTPSLLSPTDTSSIFTPDSSIPDVSPRESAETVRTFM